MYTLFKEKSNYPDFLLIRVAHLIRQSGVLLYCNAREPDCREISQFQLTLCFTKVRHFSSHLHTWLHMAHIKGKAVPLQAWSGPEDSMKLRFPDFMATAQDGKVSLTHRPHLPPRKYTLYSFLLEAESTPGP